MNRRCLSLLVALTLCLAGRASAQPSLTVTPVDVPPGANVTVTIAGTPGQSWAVGGSYYGTGFVLGGVPLALGADAVVLGVGVLDGTGTASFSFTPPPSGLTTLFYVQAVTAADPSFASPQASASITLRPAGVFTNAPVFPHGLSAGGARITEAGAPVAPTDAANKAYVDGLVSGGSDEASGPAGGDLAGSYPNPTISPAAGTNIVAAINGGAGTVADARLSGNVALRAGGNSFAGANAFSSLATFAAGLNAGGARIQAVGTPVAADDAATKAYVDTMGSGTDVLRLGQLASASTSDALVGAEQTGSGPLLRLRTNSGIVPGASTPINREMLRVGADGGIVAVGELGVGVIPATGAGYRTMWYPFKAAFRTGGVSGTEWDDPNIGFYSFAGGNNSTASAFGSFAFGDQMTVSAVDAAGFGASSVVSGTAAFSSGASNVASGFGSITMGFTNRATGQGSVAIGYRVAACGDYGVALGQRASTSSAPIGGDQCAGTAYDGSFVFGDQSTIDYFASAANNEFAVRAAGGFRFRTNSTATTGCNLPAGSGVFSCSSDRNLKSDFATLDGEAVLHKIAAVPVTTWRFLDENAAVRHAGPMAQDFFAAFGLGDSDRMIGYTDINGINMRAIQALEVRTRELMSAEERIRALEERLTRMEAQLATLIQQK